MNLLKKLLALIEKGWATKDEKEEVANEVEKLPKEDKEEIKEEVEKVDALPEEEVKEGEDKEVKEEAKAFLKKELKIAREEIAKEYKEEFDAKLEKAVKEEIELKSKKAGIYNPEIQKEAKRKKMNQVMKGIAHAILNGDDSMLKEMTTDATGTPYGGYVVDSELSAEIRHLVTEYGVARREASVITLSKNSYKANDLVTDVTVNWVDEAGVIGSTQAVLGQSTLELKKLGAICTLTNELLDDEEVDLFSFLASRVAEGFAEKEDEAFFNGDGTSTYGSFTGALVNTSVNEVTMTGTTFASMDAEDLWDMIVATPQGARKNGKFYMHISILGLIRTLKSTDGIYLYQAPSETGPATIWGKPVVEVEVMPEKSETAVDTSFVLFGDMKKASIYGIKGGLKAEMFNAGVVRNVAGDADINLITTDRKAVRWVERVGFIFIIPTALTKLTTASASA
jgi:HK97 family phage major capsid protein